MNKFPIFYVLALTFFFPTAFGQETNSNEIGVSDEDQIILFTTAILIVVGIFIFIARNSIRRKKTTYDEGDFSSKKDNVYEKYITYIFIYAYMICVFNLQQSELFSVFT